MCCPPSTPLRRKDAGIHRLVEQPQEFPAGVEGAQPPQREHSALTLFLQMLCVVFPVKLVIEPHPDKLMDAYNLHISSLSGQCLKEWPGLPKVYGHFQKPLLHKYCLLV